MSVLSFNKCLSYVSPIFSSFIMKKKLALLFFLVTGSLSYCVAQNYDVSIGGRVGLPIGVTYKQFFTRNTAFEIIAGVNRGPYGAVLIEQHGELFERPLQFLYGGGGHVGMADEELSIGVDGILGLEFTFDNSPFNFGFDVKPTYAYRFGRFGLFMEGGFFLRYVIK